MKTFFSIVTILTIIVSCNSNKEEPLKEEEKQEKAVGNTVAITPLQMKTAGIELGTIELKN